MKEIKLSIKEAKLLLGYLDNIKFDNYYQLWEFVDNDEIIRLENKLLKCVKD